MPVFYFENFSCSGCNARYLKSVYLYEGPSETKRKGMNALEDCEIVRLYLARDESAIEKTAEKYGSRLRALSFNIVGDMQTAEECENDTYLKAWRSIPPCRPENCLYAYLSSIARNVSIDICRKRSTLKRGAHIFELSAELEQCIPASDDVEKSIDGAELTASLNRFVLSLDEEKRNIFLRRYYYLDSVAEIARRFSLSENNVKTILHRCRKKLRRQLEKEDYTI